MHNEKDPTNDNVPRTHEAIALGPTGNFNGTYKFFCLKIGRVLKRRRWISFPMPDRVIKKVDTWGRHTRRDVCASPEFRNWNKEHFEWDYEDDLDRLVEDREVAHPEIPAKFPGVALEVDTPVAAIE